MKTVHVVVADCGLNGPAVMGAFATEQGARQWLNHPSTEAIRMDVAHSTGFQGFDVYEVPLES